MKLTFEDLKTAYDKIATDVICMCSFVTQFVGGQPATDEGLRGFVQHHLGLEGAEADKAIARIKREELGDMPVPSETGELEERISYGINVIRRTKIGPYLGNWMVQACAKQAASRLGMFVDYKGTGLKGGMSEAGNVSASGISLLETDHPDKIYLISPDDSSPVKTYYSKFQGSVTGSKGRKSIVHDSECAPPGTRFEFRFQFIGAGLKDDDIRDFLALMMVVGLGSVKSLGNGRFKIEEADIQRKQLPKRGKPEVDAKKDKNGEAA